MLLRPARCVSRWPSHSQIGASTPAHVDTAGSFAAVLRCVWLPGSIFHPGAMETHAFRMNTSESCSLSAGVQCKTRAGYSAENTKRVSG